MIALKINMPDISDDIVFNCSAILADAITNDNVEVSKMLMLSLSYYQTNV